MLILSKKRKRELCKIWKFAQECTEKSKEQYETAFLRCLSDTDCYMRNIRSIITNIDKYTQHGRCNNINTRLILRRLTESVETMQYMLDTVRNGQKLIEFPTTKTIFNAIEPAFRYMSIKIRNNKIYFETKPIEFNSVCFGVFEIIIAPYATYNPRSNEVIRVKAKTPRRCPHDTTITHPHVSNERICVGEATTALATCVKNYELESLLTLVVAGLETYYPDAAYRSVSAWEDDYEENTCFICGTVVDDDDGETCTLCDNYACGHHAGSCTVCASVACHECGNVCTACGAFHCNACLLICDNCSEYCCSDCEQFCHVCNSGICEYCAIKCNNCDEFCCKNCCKLCDTCNTFYCTNCLKTCADYNYNCCSKCAKLCREPCAYK